MNAQAKQLPSLDRVLELLDYDPVTGKFRWRVDRGGGARSGDVAGTVLTKRSGTKYLIIRMDGLARYAHRLAFLYMTGECPEIVDHEDLDGLNNRWKNLRDGTAGNRHNVKKRAHNVSGHKNVHWHNQKQRWSVVVAAGGVRRHRYFKTLDEAVISADKLRKELHGEFARAA